MSINIFIASDDDVMSDLTKYSLMAAYLIVLCIGMAEQIHFNL